MPRTGWLALGACLGALAAGADDRRWLAVVLTAGALAGLAVVVTVGAPRARIVAVGLGVAAIVVRSILLPSPPAVAGTPAGSGPWSMVVETVGSPRDGHQVATVRTIDAGPDGFRLAATLPRYPLIEPGDRIEVTGRLRPRPDSPYGDYLARLDAWGVLDARTLELHTRPVDPGTLLEGWRRDAGDALTRVLPEPEAGLAAGIIIGLRDRVDRAVATAFTTAGVSHVVAISGWNIAIVAAAVTAVAGGLGRRRRSVVIALAIGAYIAFAGASPSVVRAGAMAAVVLIARESGRTGRAAAALGWAVVLLLLADPGLIVDAGFQLSSLATAGLIAWATPLSRRLDVLTRGRLPRWLSESLGVSLAAQASTLPIVLASFGRLALVAPAVNLLIVPLVAPAMAAGIVALLGGLLVSLGGPSAVGIVVAVPAWVALRLMIGIVDVSAAVPMASVAFDPAVGVGLGVASSIIAGIVIAWHRQRRAGPGRRAGAAVAERRSSRPGAAPSRAMRVAAYGLVVAVGSAGAVAVTAPAGIARVTVLDVGQGDAILVEGSRGGRLLIDGGPDPDRLLVELDRRVPPWDRRIDVVVLSHPHEDHVAGLALLLARYRVARVLEPGMRGPGPGYAAWLDALRRPGAPTRGSIAAGDRLVVDEVAIRVLWPIRGRVPSEPSDSGTGINNVSVVMLGSIGTRRFLLAGDIEEDVDRDVIVAGLPTVDLLKVAHHGSRTATTEAFVAATRPRVAVASAGTGNPYGHPARATMDRLAAAGARVMRTDRDGSVTVSFDDDGLTVRAEPRRGSTATGPGAALAAIARAATAAATVGEGPQRSWWCGIPIPDEGQDQDDPPAPPTAAGPTPSVATLHDPGFAAPLGYHRVDDRPWSGGSRRPALVPRPPTLVPRPLARGRRDRRLPRPADRGERDRAGSRGDRSGCAAPRRRQDPARWRSGPDPPPRHGLGSLADRPWARRIGPVGRGPPGDEAGRRRRTSTLGGLRQPRGTGRGLRRQARRPAP